MRPPCPSVTDRAAICIAKKYLLLINHRQVGQDACAGTLAAGSWSAWLCRVSHRTRAVARGQQNMAFAGEGEITEGPDSSWSLPREKSCYQVNLERLNQETTGKYASFLTSGRSYSPHSQHCGSTQGKWVSDLLHNRKFKSILWSLHLEDFFILHTVTNRIMREGWGEAFPF